MAWQPHFGQEKKLKTKLTIDDVIEIHNTVVVGFGPRICTHTFGVYA